MINMDQIAVAAILRSYGKWIKREPFIKLVSEKRDVKERQAYNLIKKAHQNKEILKHILSDKTTLYGLPEFGPLQWKSLEIEPEIKETRSLGFFEYLKYRSEKKQQQEIRERLESCSEIDFLAKEYPSFEPLKDWSDNQRKEIEKEEKKLKEKAR
jgi:hypothetical protein